MAETEVILLKRFVRSGDAEAFAEIIRLYAGLVYSAALRVLADVDRASDVAQETFLQLAKDAGNVTGSLPGWLHRVATHKAIDQVRRDTTRRHREAEYTARRPQEAAEWKDISPYVDEGLNLLEPHLRNILVSYFLEGLSTREIARGQGVSQATVSRRIEMGVELLRAGLRRRGILIAAGALSVLLGENAAQAAPPILLTELGKIALISGSLAATTAGTSTASGLSTVLTSVLAVIKTNAVAVAALVAIGAGALITYQQAAKPSRQASADSVAQSPAVLDPSANSMSNDAQMQDAGSGEQMALVADMSRRATPQRPVAQALPGPEAETDPRTYVPGISDGAMDTVSGVAQEDSSAQTLPPVAMDSNPVAAAPVLDGGQDRGVPAVRESPYEMVARLRGERTDRESEPADDPNLLTAVPTGPVLTKVELKLVPPFYGCPGGVLGIQRQDTTDVRPANVVEVPPDAPREPVYFTVRVGDRTIQGITYRSVRSRGDVMLYLDTDDDGLWSDERAYVGRRLWGLPWTATYEFGPVYLKQGSSEPGGDSFYAQCSDGRWLTFWPAFYRDGTVVLDGRTYRIDLMDCDFDGRFNDLSSPVTVADVDQGCDMLAIDLNGDWQFVYGPMGEPEVIPLGKVIRVAGQYYAVEVAEDGSTIELRRADPSPGGSNLAWQNAAPKSDADANGPSPDGAQDRP